MPFLNRSEAGRRLAEALRDYAGLPVVVFALPRGGLPVALEVAKVLRSSRIARISVFKPRAVAALTPQIATKSAKSGIHSRIVSTGTASIPPLLTVAG